MLAVISDDQEPFIPQLPTASSPTRNRPAEPLWNVQVNHLTWSCELRFHGETYGWEAQILWNGELFAAHGAFVLKGDACRWAVERRKHAERGFLEDA
jgi:hypothetical protein